MSEKLPKQYKKFKESYPSVSAAYEALGDACHTEGPLDQKTRRLVKLAMAVCIGSEGAVHSNVRRGLDEGLTEDELKQVALLAIPTIGLPKSQAALTWIEDIL